MSMLSELAQYLADQGHGIVAAGGDTGTIFAGQLPDRPDDCVGLLESGGEPPIETFGAAADANPERPRLQVLVRAGAENYDAGRALAYAVWKALHEVANQTIGGVFYQSIRALQSPAGLGRDDSQRWEWSINFQITKQPS